jgi:hypothetical protein
MTTGACGPNWMPLKLRILLFGWFFEASCVIHDVGYKEGGDEIRRLVCDWKFLLAMLRDTLKGGKTSVIPKLVAAFVYFIGVRVGGWASFEYK